MPTLQEAQPHRVQRLEAVAGAEQRIAPLDPLARGHQLLELVDLAERQPHRQAKFAQVAVRTGYFQMERGKARRIHHRSPQASTGLLQPRD
jgi:hypothetical protein